MTAMKRIFAWGRSLRDRLRPSAHVPAMRRRSTVIAVALPVVLVAAIAGKVSYSHITALGLRTHQGAADSHLLFLPIDGLIVAGTVILAAGSSLGWLGVGLGVAATLFANLQFGLPHGALSAVVSTWPAIAFSVACFMVERWLRSQRRGEPADVVPSPGFSDAETAALASLRATLAAGNPWSQNQLQDRYNLTRAQASRVRQLVLAGSNGHDTGSTA
jgi:hypothetical protein